MDPKARSTVAAAASSSGVNHVVITAYERK